MSGSGTDVGESRRLPLGGIGDLFAYLGFPEESAKKLTVRRPVTRGVWTDLVFRFGAETHAILAVYASDTAFSDGVSGLPKRRMANSFRPANRGLPNF
ncbi:MAG: hypothetical protein QG650_457 [Patescibacteria group bacterium]|nr:hypothetical protein [Patescibacteria group bacterium]